MLYCFKVINFLVEQIGGLKVRIKLFGILLIGSLLLTACSGETTQEDMYEHMEESVRLEQDFVAQQQPLTELEAEEQAIYEEISVLGMDDYDEIYTLAERAIESIEERRDLTENEKASIDAAKKEFDQIEPLIGELDNDDLKELATKMFNGMEERYQAFLALNEAYTLSLDYDKELYQLLQQEDLEESEFSDQVDKVNDQYQVVIGANQEFNDKTDQFNQLKRDFYNASNLNVTYE